MKVNIKLSWLKNAAHFLELIFIVVSIFLYSCSKDNSSNPPTPTSITVAPKTSLTITILDDQGVKISGVKVHLYANQNNYLNRQSEIDEDTTDTNGNVTFSNGLTTIRYYFYAEKGCLNNSSGIFTTPASMLSNKSNSVWSQLVAGTSGSILIQDTSINKFDIYYGTTFYYEMNGHDSYQIYNLPIGPATMRVIQVTGVITTPIDENLFINLSCSQNSTLVIP